MVCPKCHAIIEDSPSFCSNCGHSILQSDVNTCEMNQSYKSYTQYYNRYYKQPHDSQYNCSAELAQLGTSALTLSIIALIFIPVFWVVSVIIHPIAWSIIRRARAINGGGKRFNVSSLNVATFICNIVLGLVIAIGILIGFSFFLIILLSS